MGMRSNLRVTARTVRTAKPGTLIWDAEVKGFGLRTLASGARVYVLKYRTGSRQRWFTIGQHGSPWTPDAARTRARELLAQVAKGADPASDRQRRRSNPSVADLVKQFMAEHVAVKTKPRTAIEYGRVLDRFIVPELGRMPTMDVRPEDIAKLHHALRATPRQANIAINVARKMFKLAEGWGYRVTGSNPCIHIDRFREDAAGTIPVKLGNRAARRRSEGRAMGRVDRADSRGMARELPAHGAGSGQDGDRGGEFGCCLHAASRGAGAPFGHRCIAAAAADGSPHGRGAGADLADG